MSYPANRHPDVKTTFNDAPSAPQIDSGACVHPMACVIGRVIIESGVMVAPFASLRGDEGGPVFIGRDANVQDAVIVHALETQEKGATIPCRYFEVDGQAFAVYIGPRVSLAHQCHIHGPAKVEEDTFVGMQSLVFCSTIGRGCVLEPSAKVIGVVIPPQRVVPAGEIITRQEQADALPRLTDQHPMAKMNEGVVRVNTQLAAGYNELFGNGSDPSSGTDP